MDYPSSSKLWHIGRNEGDRLHMAFHRVFFMLRYSTYYFCSYSMAQAGRKAKALLQNGKQSNKNKNMQKEGEKVIITK